MSNHPNFITPDLQLTVLRMNYVREMSLLKVREMEAENERLRLNLALKNSATVYNTELEQRLLNRFNSLIKEFSECCQKCRWEKAELQEFILSATALKAKIELYCNFCYQQPDTLQLHQHLKRLIDFTAKAYADSEVSAKYITFDLNDRSRKNWEQMQLIVFDTAFIPDMTNDKAFI
ncbi:MAG: hypothetical protein U0X91_03550 [Spirosomataceae bacterium]